MNLASLVDIPALIAPDAPALIGTRAVDYATLRSAVGRGAGLLSELGVGHGDRVGIFATNSVEVIEVMFAAASLGAVVVPMNYKAKQREVAHLLSDSGVKVLVTETRYVGLIDDARPENVEHVLMLDTDAADGWRRRAAEADELFEIAEVDDRQLCVLLYTSGTTSLPKGVMLTHGALTDYVMGRAEPADGDDHGRMLLAAPLYHIAGVTSMLGALYSGRTVVIMSQFDADEWFDLVERERATHAFLVPTMLARLIDHPDLGSRDLSSLEVITYGAAPMPPAVIRRALELLPSSVGFSQAYGQTETTSTVTVLTPDDHRIEGAEEEIAVKLRRLGSVGRPVDDVELRVVGDDGEELGSFEIGQVQLRTPRQMTGYWGSGSSRTAETIDDEGWIHTGDLGHVDDGGYLFLGGRSGEMIIRGGENVSPQEIESVLYDHPDVLEAGVVGVPDEEWGERILAVVVLRPNSELDLETMREYCREQLAGFKRPDVIHIVEQLPRTSTGKLLRRDLAALIAG